MKRKCYGQCDEHGKVLHYVHVYGRGSWTKDNAWPFWYCENAIAIDRADGWTVEITDEGASER